MSSWLRIPSAEEVPAEVRQIWDQAKARNGFVSTGLRALALRPAHLTLWLAHITELMAGESRLTSSQRQMIAVVVSALNRSPYGVISHSAQLRGLTNDPSFVDQLGVNYRQLPLDKPTRLMLDFAAKVTQQSDLCREDDIDLLREAGWADEDIHDIAEIASMFNFVNRLANACGWAADPEHSVRGTS